MSQRLLRSWRILFCLLWCGVSATAEQPELGTITGRVSSALTAEPLRKVNLVLSGDDKDKPIHYFTKSDAEGRFTFNAVKPGEYTLKGERYGYLEQSWGKAGASRIGEKIQVLPGQILADVQLRLTPYAVVAGRVLDQDGDPSVSGSAEVYQYAWKVGKPQLVGVASAELDDHGEFRIANLAPGRYCLKVQPTGRRELEEIQSSDNGQERELDTWYPSVIEQTNATPLVLTAGQELTGLEWRVQRKLTYQVKGKLTGLTLKEITVGGRYSEPFVGAAQMVNGRPAGIRVSSRINPDGSFQLRGLPPGTYQLQAGQISDSRKDMQFVELGRITVTVANRNVEDIIFPLASPRSVTGRTVGEGDDSKANWQVSLSSLEGDAWRVVVQVAEDGTFHFDRLGAERYRVTMQSPNDGYLKRMTVGEQDVPDHVLDLTAGSSGMLKLLISKKTAQITVALVKQSEPDSAAGTQVLVLPDSDKAEVREQGAKYGVWSQQGVFTINNVSPGRYRVFAWRDLPEDGWKAPGFWEEVKDQGASVTVEESDRKHVEVEAVSAPVMRFSAASTTTPTG